MGNKNSVQQKSTAVDDVLKDGDINLRLVRTYFNTPRNRAVLEIETNNSILTITSSNIEYHITIKDRGLRTLEDIICDYETAKQKIEEWITLYKCTVYENPNNNS